MHSTDYRELARSNRKKRIRHIEALKAMVDADNYRISADDIAEGILDEVDMTPVRFRRRPMD